MAKSLRAYKDFKQQGEWLLKAQVQLEVCVDSLESAIAAEAGGASRLELCDCLLVGGTTPSAGLLEVVRSRVQIPIHVLIRPRAGDFCYSETEILVMEKDIVLAKSLGAEGIVCGVLHPDGTINVGAMHRLVELARPLYFTFHRAFDMTSDAKMALEDVISLGIGSLLTSGQKATAYEGRVLLADLVQQADGRIEIMPGGGVNEQNARALVESTKAEVLHSSARRKRDSSMQFRRAGLSMGASIEDEFSCSFADKELVQSLLQAANTPL